ncbi:hypothetical protein D3C73_753410 [compost metagenome]
MPLSVAHILTLGERNRIGQPLVIVDTADHRHNFGVEASSDLDIEPGNDLQIGKRDQALDDNHIMIGA